MKKILFLAALVMVTGIVLVGCIPTGETFSYSRPEYADSPHGSVPRYREIMSPDQRYLARLTSSGISVFRPQEDGEGEVLVWFWGVGSDIKAMAWHPDSKKVAVMKHYSHRARVSVRRVFRYFSIAGGSANGWYHRMRWDEDGTGVTLSDGDEPRIFIALD